MKKGILSLAIMLITIALLMTTTNATFTANVSMKSDSTTTKVGDTVTLTISTNEKIIASNFDISYDSTMLKLEGSGTSNLSVAEKDGKIVCIYADMSGIGTSEFKVKFKALKETTGTSLKIENAKFRAEGQDKSYTGEEITGINNAITVKVEKVESTKEETPSTTPSTTPSITPSTTPSTAPSTPSTTPSTTSNDKQQTSNQIAGQNKTTTAKTSLPKTGKETGFIIAGIFILVIVAILFGKKSKELNNIFKSISVFVIALVAVTSFNKNVYAADEKPKLIYNNRLIGERYIIATMLDKSDSDRKITKSELIGVDNTINDVTCDGKSIKDTDLVKTGDQVILENYKYTVVLYGDSNKDGIVCDTDDLMTIINNYLGREELKEEKRLAANLMNTDDKLDTDDLMQMINMYLGKIEGTLVTNPPKSAIYPTTSNDKDMLDSNWKYSIEPSSNTIVLEQYIGEESNITIKQSYSLDGTQYNTRMGESKTAPNYEGPFMNNTTIKNITFESTDVFGTNVSYMFFNCTNLERVIGFGGNITDMNSCFSGCTSLKNQQNKNISDYVEGAEINIPDTVRTMNYAFNKCTSIEYLPNIGSNSELVSAIAAFKGCSGAKSGTIYLNSTVTYINEMFNGCKFLGHYSGDSFRIYSYMEPDKVYITGAFDNCGIEVEGSSGYVSKPHELIIKNATSEESETFKFFKEAVDNATSCELTVKLAE